MKWKSYLLYKNSGSEWLSEIPEHWTAKKLKYIARQIVDGTHLTPTYVENGVAFLRVTDIHSGTIDFSEVKRIPIEEHTELIKRCYPERGNLLLSKNGTIGVPCIVDWDDEFSIFVSLCLIKLSNEMDASYAKYFVLSNEIREQIHSGGKTNTVTNLHLDKIREFIFTTPPLAEQQAISTFLDRETSRIDSLIAKKQRQIELLNEKRAALISRVVTKGLNPDAKMKDSGVEWLGETPEHWIIKRVRLFSRILRGKFSHRPRNDPRMYDGPYPFIQTGDVAAAGKYIVEYHQTLSDDGFAVSKQFPKGTLVMTIAANIGDMAILDFEACFPDSIVGFVPNPGMNLHFLYYLFIAMRQDLLSTATMNTQLNLNVDRIGALVGICPPINEQVEIVTMLDRFCEQISRISSAIAQSITKLQEYRTALITAAVTGKIDVRQEATHARTAH